MQRDVACILFTSNTLPQVHIKSKMLRGKTVLVKAPEGSLYALHVKAVGYARDADTKSEELSSRDNTIRNHLISRTK